VRRTEVAEACQWARRRGDKDRRRGLGFESSQVRKDGRAVGGARSEPNRAMRRRRISSANTHSGMGRNLPRAAADGDLGLGVAHLARQPPPLSFLSPSSHATGAVGRGAVIWAWGRRESRRGREHRPGQRMMVLDELPWIEERGLQLRGRRGGEGGRANERCSGREGDARRTDGLDWLKAERKGQPTPCSLNR
jgi:hypothetical protein